MSLVSWKQTNLGTLLTYQKGFAFKSSEYKLQGHPIVRVSNFSDRSIDMTDCNYLDPSSVSKYEDYTLRAGDVALATVGSWPTNPASVVGKAIRVPSEANRALLNQNAVRLRANEEFDQRFMFYLLKSEAFQTYIIGTAQGSASQASITLKDIFGYCFSRPPLPEQRAIASILGALDDKIELNRRTNRTLEAIAQALFQSWFVDFDPVRAKAEGRDTGLPAEIANLFPNGFEESELGEIPQGWRVGCIGSVADNLRRTIQPHSIEATVPYIGLEHMPRRSIALSEWGQAEELASNKYEFRRGEILFGKLRPYFHKVGVAPIDGICSTDILVITPEKPVWFSFLLGHISSEKLVNHTDASSTGTKMPRTNWQDMARYQVVLPREPIAAAFNAHIKPLISRVIAGIHESRTLAAMRDTLLPKLLSGELRVKGAVS